MSKTSDPLTFELVLKISLKYYDSTISILLIGLLLLDLGMTSINYFNQIIGLIIIAILIIIFDLLFKYDKILNKINLLITLSITSRILVEKFIKVLLYLSLLATIITAPPGVPPTFLFSSLASIDFYFFLSILIITGLYYSIQPIIKNIFDKKFNSVT